MIGSDSSSTSIKKMQEGKYADKIFKLIWVQNLDTDEYRFRTLFQSIGSDHTILNARIDPELLFAFTAGAHYLNGEYLENPEEEGILLGIKFLSGQENKIVQLKKIFSDELYDLRVDLADYSKCQYCVVIESEAADYIFPCTVIAGTYYFLSSSMCRQIFAQNLKAFCDEDRIRMDPKSRTAEIHLDYGKDEDAPEIIRFIKNDNARKHWHEISNNMRKSEADLRGQNQWKGTVPIIADFPFAQEFRMDVRAFIRFYPKANKSKILILEILQEDSLFPFDKVTIHREGQPSKVLDVRRRVKARTTSRVITTTPPNTNLARIIIKNMSRPKNIYKDEIEIEKQYTESPDNEIIVPRVEHSGDIVDIGLGSASSNDEEVRPGDVVQQKGKSTKNESEGETKEGFSLQDFKEMVKPLAETEGVADFSLVGPRNIPIRTRRSPHATGTIREYSDKVNKISRQYMTATFRYGTRGASLIEIDQNGLPSRAATYLIVCEKGETASNKDVCNFVQDFVDEENIADIRRPAGSLFYSKHHPISKGETAYSIWRAFTLWKISTIQGTAHPDESNQS